MSNHLSAYRTLILDNGMKAEKHKVLFDTGAQVNIISEQHPILDEATIYSKGQLKVKGVFDNKFSIANQYCELSVSYECQNEIKNLNQEIIIWIIPNIAYFGVILELKSIQKYNITVGRKILIVEKMKSRERERKSEDLRKRESAIQSHSSLFAKGDLVKVKQVQKPGQIKK